MGSILDARAAGSHTASSAIAVRMSGADTNTVGSQKEGGQEASKAERHSDAGNDAD